MYTFGEQNGTNLGFWFKFGNFSPYFFTNNLRLTANIAQHLADQNIIGNNLIIDLFDSLGYNIEFIDDKVKLKPKLNTPSPCNKDNIGGYCIELANMDIQIMLQEVIDQIILRWEAINL
jgi:hypothetical protein